MGSSGILLIIGVAAVAGLYAWYASIVARRNKVQEALSSVDVHLNQRHDLIPNIVQLAARFMEHERSLLTDVTRLREEARQIPATVGDAGKRFALEGELSQRVGQLLGRMEAYPALKSDRPLLEAQQTWTETEAQITAARRFYNAAVNQLNNAIQIFPGQLIAAAAGVKSMPLFEAPAAARTAPSVDAILGPKP
jgi:LemA protein